MSGAPGDGSDGAEKKQGKMKTVPGSPRVCPPQSPRSPPPYLGSREASESPNVESHDGDEEGKDSSYVVPTSTGVVGKGGSGPFSGSLSFTRFSSDMERIKRAELDSSRDFEQMRASYFADQYHAHRSYFEAFCAVIPVYKDSLQRTVRYFLGRVAIQRKMVEWSCELNDSILGAKKGTTKSHLYKVKKALSKCTLTTQFDNQNNDTETAVIWAAKASNIPLHMRRKASLEQLVRRGSGTSHHSRQSSEMSLSGDVGLGFVDAEPTMKRHVIEEMTQSDVEIASRFDMLADFTEMCVLKPVDVLEKEYIKESDEIVKCGREMLDSLQSLDTHVARCYEQLSKEINDNLLYKGGGASEGMKAVDVGDCWLANMQYSVSVDHQRHGWTLINSTMRDLFERFRTLELKRRMEMKRAIEAVCIRQEKMFSELPLVTRIPHNSAESISVDVSTLEEELMQQMRDNVSVTQDTKGSKGQLSGRAGLDEPTGPPADTPSISSEAAPLVMKSPLIYHCGIVQRRKDGAISSSWNLAVAVLTRDHFLHIFDVSKKDKNLTLDSKVEEGFEYVQPQLWPKGINSSKKELQHAMLEPSVSLDVSQNYTNPCKSASKQKHARQFEVIEVKMSVGMKGAFKSESRRLLHMRAPSETSMMEWVVKLKAADPRNGTNEEAIRLAHF
eukprot:286272_1